MVGASLDISRMANDIYDSDFILDKIAIELSGISKEQFIKNYERILNINQPILINSVFGDRLYPPRQPTR